MMIFTGVGGWHGSILICDRSTETLKPVQHPPLSRMITILITIIIIFLKGPITGAKMMMMMMIIHSSLKWNVYVHGWWWVALVNSHEWIIMGRKKWIINNAITISDDDDLEDICYFWIEPVHWQDGSLRMKLNWSCEGDNQIRQRRRRRRCSTAYPCND